MNSSSRNYYRPANKKDLSDLMAQRESQPAPLVHGTRDPIGQFSGADAVIDLNELHLNKITVEGTSIRIGGQVILQDVIESPELIEFANGILPEACLLAAHLGLRHLSTLGGVLLSRDRAAELKLALLALGADLVVMSAATMRTVSLKEYQPQIGDIVVEVILKMREEKHHGALARVARTPLDEAIVAIVAIQEMDVCRIAASGIGEPFTLIEVQDGETLEQIVEKVLNAAHPFSDYRGSTEYRRAMAGVLTKRAMQAMLGRN